MPTPNLTLAEKLGQLFMIGFEGHEVPGDVADFIAENHIGFVILFTRNVSSPAQTAHLTNHIHSLGDIQPAIYTDQEGGLVVRFGEMAATAISHMGLAATGDPKNARSAGQIIGKDMKNLGIDGVFAPVLDVNINEDNPVIGTRAFSDHPGMVTRFGRALALGLGDEGIGACGKHFPGHGAAVTDSHHEIPVIDLPEKQFKQYCLQPFIDLAGDPIDSIMSAHIHYPELSTEIATFSPYFIPKLLREQAAYDGVVFTDCLEMEAIRKHSTPERIITGTIKAGIDVLSVSHKLDLQRELLEILSFKIKSGAIPEERIHRSLARIFNLKEKLGLLRARRQINPAKAGKQVRSSRAAEAALAAQSITLLRNRKGILPIDKEKSILILEWRKEIASADFSGRGHLSALGRIAAETFPNLTCRLLKTGAELPVELEKELADYDVIIACPFSLTPGGAAKQGQCIKSILAVRNDLVAAALGNPYDIRHFPDINTYIVSYGSREVQLEALIRVLCGEVAPKGKLPVEIAGLFNRGEGLGY